MAEALCNTNCSPRAARYPCGVSQSVPTGQNMLRVCKTITGSSEMIVSIAIRCHFIDNSD
ncbi:hypothetical protein KIN20_020500 [Parelaphostrongylus tenuis]|uniref:Uncharacterized protein n=1 Tax=Parelaphostrongylus tenuis TaxID=148309 RepID=A0AAD5QTS7_PARTN|nr:hypothetical protein KIN20_020500 [Parelaphostrongylus tenuis]